MRLCIYVYVCIYSTNICIFNQCSLVKYLPDIAISTFDA